MVARRALARTFAGQRSSTRRKTEWIAAEAPWATKITNTITVLFSFSQAVLADLVPFTIVRTVGMFGMAPDEDFILDQDVFGAVGLMVVREGNRAAGSVSLPGPIINIGDDGWWLHMPFMHFVESINTASQGIMQPFESRAMRKVEDGDAIVGMIQLDSTSDNAEVAFMVRILCKLH